MRLRKKAWAVPEMEASNICCLDAKEHEGHWKE